MAFENPIPAHAGYIDGQNLLMDAGRLSCHGLSIDPLSREVKLRGEVVELVVFIFKANSSRTGRAAHVAQILERLQVVDLLVRLSKDMRLMAAKQFSEVVVLTDSIGRQAQGWAKSSALLADS